MSGSYNLNLLDSCIDEPNLKIGASTVLMCATAESCLEWWRTKNIASFKSELYENLLYFINKYSTVFYKDDLLSRITMSGHQKGSCVYIPIAAIPVGLIATNIEEAELLSKAVAEIFNSNAEDIAGAQAICTAIFIARSTKNIDDISTFINSKYYNLDDVVIKTTSKLNAFTSKEYVPVAIKCALKTNSQLAAVALARLYYGPNSELCALIGSLAEQIQRDGIDGYKCCNSQALFKNMPIDLLEIYRSFHTIRSKRKQFDNTPCQKFEKFQDVFVESDEFGLVTKHCLPIYHNFVLGGSSYEFYDYGYSFDANNTALSKDPDFISMDEDVFIWIAPFIVNKIVDWDQYSLHNPCKIQFIVDAHAIVQQVKVDLENEEITELLQTTFAKSEPTINWKLLFENKYKIIKFYDAFFWYFLERKKYQNDYVINIAGY